jgi:hypothetical protein
MPITLERIPIEKQIYAKCLLESGMSIRTVAHRVKLAPDTVNNIAWKQDYSASTLENFKKRLPFKLYRYADDMLDLVDYDEMKKAPLGTKMISVGIAIDKARDMEGSNRPVFNIVTVVNEAQRTLSKLDAQLALLDDADKAQRPMLDGRNEI